MRFSKKNNLVLAIMEKMFNVEALIKKEPELFEDLCKDYPLDDGFYLFKVEKEKPKKEKGEK